MKITTNSILVLFGIIALMMVACLPIAVLAAPLLRQEQSAPVDSAATLQAMVTQTIVAMTLNAPTQTPIPATVTPVPATVPTVPEWRDHGPRLKLYLGCSAAALRRIEGDGADLRSGGDLRDPNTDGAGCTKGGRHGLNLVRVNQRNHVSAQPGAVIDNLAVDLA